MRWAANRHAHSRVMPRCLTACRLSMRQPPPPPGRDPHSQPPHTAPRQRHCSGTASHPWHDLSPVRRAHWGARACQQAASRAACPQRCHGCPWPRTPATAAHRLQLPGPDAKTQQLSHWVYGAADVPCMAPPSTPSLAPHMRRVLQGADAPNVVNCVIEIPRGSKVGARAYPRPAALHAPSGTAAPPSIAACPPL